MANEVKIRIRAFPYTENVEDPVTGEIRPVERIARRGDVVELNDADYSRAVRFEAIHVDGEDEGNQPEPSSGVAPDPYDASAEELAEWFKSSRPTVDEIVELAEEDTDLAAKLLEAEDLATGQQPRSILVEKLQKIIIDNA